MSSSSHTPENQLPLEVPVAGRWAVGLARACAARPWRVILAWVLLVLFVRLAAPRWDDVTNDGDLSYLPATMPSVQGEKLLELAFPDNRARSQLVLAIARDDRPLDDVDREVADDLTERCEAKQQDADWPLLDVWSRHSEVVGQKLRSTDRQATLIVLQLSNEFMATDNIRLLELAQAEIGALKAEWGERWPAGLQVEISGSAAVGGDMLLAASESLEHTEGLTILLVLAILLVVYRAPLLMAVPLVTIALSLSVAIGFVAALTQLHHLPGFSWWGFQVFTTTRIFIVVILYGSGTDFCLFLIARFREELQQGRERVDAVAAAAAGVTDALLGSALTTILGLAAMVFADFGKFRSSGPAIGLCLLVTLIACLTLAPALLSALGTRVFWPWKLAAGLPASLGDSTAPAVDRVERRTGWRWFWDALARFVVARPIPVLLISGVLFAPLAWHGARNEHSVTYDLLNELAPTRASRVGTSLLERHFPVGESDPLIVIVERPGARFGDADHRVANDSLERLDELTRRLLQDVPAVKAVRFLGEPLGDPPRRLSLLSSAGRQKLMLRNHPLTKRVFLGQGEPYAGNVTRLELIIEPNAFSPEAIAALNDVDLVLQKVQAESNSFWKSARFVYAGTTASIRDLRVVTRRDHQTIRWVVSLAVLAILILLLRRPVVCLLLIVTVVISYWATLGASMWFFQWLDGSDFSGLDWKVPTFLFVILVAVGEDYNIYLTTRFFEEERRWGWREGLRRAIDQTGGVITSCGVIMAGSFVSMVSSSLRAMVELGFALTLGILIDTFLVRTIVVPALLSLLNHRR
ncbi:MAG: MMPL family transporter, partial [Planctomycetota bacterium]